VSYGGVVPDIVEEDLEDVELLLEVELRLEEIELRLELELDDEITLLFKELLERLLRLELVTSVLEALLMLLELVLAKELRLTAAIELMLEIPVLAVLDAGESVLLPEDPPPQAVKPITSKHSNQPELD
jgi:hypothetical protein